MIDLGIIDDLVREIVPIANPGEADAPTVLSRLNENVHYFLTRCNGGYSKDNYFRFIGRSGDVANNIEVWNSAELWKGYYNDLVLDYCFFAEDIFGNQFGHKVDGTSDEIFLFWIDDGRLEPFATDFEEFLDFTIFGTEVFKEMRELSKKFQSVSSEKFRPYHHLAYKTPILLGGNAGDPDNLEFSYSVDHLRFLGQIVTQCRALSLGTQIIDVLIDEGSQTVTLVAK